FFKYIGSCQYCKHSYGKENAGGEVWIIDNYLFKQFFHVYSSFIVKNRVTMVLATRIPTPRVRRGIRPPEKREPGVPGLNPASRFAKNGTPLKIPISPSNPYQRVPKLSVHTRTDSGSI